MSWRHNFVFGDRDETIDCAFETDQTKTSSSQDAQIRVVNYTHVSARLAGLNR